jgi:hypothetical protein
MASLLGFAGTLQELQAEVRLHEHSLPFAPREPPLIIVVPSGEGIGRVDAPAFPSAGSLSVARIHKRVKSGRAAAFVLAPVADAGCGDLHCSVLASMTAVVLAHAELKAPDAKTAPRAAADLPTPAQLLPVTYHELSHDHSGVLLSVPVPDSAPEGSRVVMTRVSIGDCSVALGEAPLQTIVGFNHSPETEGPVHAAAYAGDVAALTRLLEDGASTEVVDEVGCVVSLVPHPPS